MNIGIIREGKSPVDHRVAFTPEQCLAMQKKYGVTVYVQKSAVRSIPDSAYEEQGLTICEDISHCDILFGVKEVPIKDLITDKTYFFFSHTIKAQPYNKTLLQAILEKNITIVDYECLKKDGARVVAFGRFAGIVGAYNGLLTYGKKFNLYDLEPANQCKDLDELWNELKKVKLDNVKIVLTGAGRVSQGAVETLNHANIPSFSEEEYTSKSETGYLQVDINNYNKRKDGSPFDRNEFFNTPELFESTFSRLLPSSDLLIAGAYWDPAAPALFTKEEAKSEKFNIKVIADITCDIEGSIPTTIKPTTIADPVFDINLNSFTEEKAYSKLENLTVMAVDNLPCEVPKDASESFGSQLSTNVLDDLLLNNGKEIIEYATIAKNGDLTSYYEYLRDYVS